MRQLLTALLLTATFLLTGCGKPKPTPFSENLTSQVQSHDVTFYSNSLHRDETYRVTARRTFLPGQRLHVVYLPGAFVGGEKAE